MADKLVINMGFVNTPYTKETIAKPMTAAKQESARARKRHFSKTKDAEKVSNILEDKYGILDYFNEKYSEYIETLISNRFDDIAEEVLSRPEGRQYTTAKMSNIMKPVGKDVEKLFREFLDKEEMNASGQAGIPTGAAMMGIRHGIGSKTLKGVSRPSFIDTGIYRASFRCSVDKK